MKRKLFNAIALLSAVLCVAFFLFLRECYSISEGGGDYFLRWRIDGLGEFLREPVPGSRVPVAICILIATAALPMFWLIGFLISLRGRQVRRRRLLQQLCPACGYDLRATPNRCPECGAVPRKKEVVAS